MSAVEPAFDGPAHVGEQVPAVCKDADDVTLGALGAGSPAEDGTGERYEIHRDDLLNILSEAVAGVVTFEFGRSSARSWTDLMVCR